MTTQGVNIGVDTPQAWTGATRAPARVLSRPGGHAIAATTVRSLRDSAEGMLSPAPSLPILARPTTSEADQEIRSTAEILVIDDCTMQRENVAAVICRDGRATPAEAWDLPSLHNAVAEASPQVVLLTMTTRDSITLLRAVRRVCPTARVIVIGVAEDDSDAIIGCAEAGVAGYHMRTDSINELLSLISRVGNGEFACPPAVSAILINHLSTLAAAQKKPSAKELVLTDREMQILRMLEMGLANRDIADQLCITLHTVKNHVHSVLNKLGVNTRTEAAAISRSLR